MPLSWKALGRTLELITIVLLIVAVRYLWVKADSKGTEPPEAPQFEIQAPEAKTETIQRPYQPPVPTSADPETYPQPAESTAPIVVADIYLGAAPDSLCSSPETLIKLSDSIADSPNGVIEEAAKLLDQAIKGHREELAENKQTHSALINEILLSRYDRRYAAQLVLARHWRTASDEERDRFVNAFYCHTIRRFAEDMLEFDLAGLTILPSRGDATKKRTTVKTYMMLDDGTRVSVNYRMVKRDSGWKIFDVTIEGISYVRNFKAETNAEILTRGLPGVIARLEAGTSTGDEE